MKIKHDVVHISHGPLGYFGVAQQEGAYKALGAKPTLRSLLEASMQAESDPHIRSALQTIRLRAEELKWNDGEIEKEFPAD